MVKALPLFFLLLFSLVMSGCSKPAGPGKELVVSMAGLFSTTSDLHGGAIVRLVNNTAGTTQNIQLTAPPFNVAMVDGNWSIYVIGFIGPTAFTGEKHCGQAQNITLNAETTSINITATTGNCNQAGTPYSAMMTGIVTPSTLTATSAAYGSVVQGASGSSTITLTNNGPQSISVSAITVSGSVFTVGSFTSCSSVAPSSTCSFVLNLNTSTTGAKSQNVFVNYNNGISDVLFTINSTATVVTPASLSISDGPTYSFGNVVNFASGTKNFTITNTGGAPASAVNFVAPSGAFSATNSTGNSTCSGTIAPAASCTFDVTFTPTSAIAYSDSLLVNYNDGLAANSASRALSGSGIDLANLSISGSLPASVVPSSSQDITLTITNTSSSVSASSVSGPSLGGVLNYKGGGTYPGAGGTCTGALGLAGSCTIVLTYSPTSLGPYSYSFIMNYNNSVSSTSSTKSLTSQVVTPASLSFGMPSWDFGIILSGSNVSKVITITNSGGYPASGLSFSSIIAPLTGSGSSCSTTLGPGASCSLTITFSPTASAVLSNNYTVSYLSPSAQNTTISFNGVGVATAPVNPLYTNGANWNDYVTDNPAIPGYLNEVDSACVASGSSPCHHGGELRKVTLSGYTSCGAFSGFADSLNAFDWDCNDNGGSGPVIFRSKGFKPGMGLRNLVNASSWKSMNFGASIGGTPVFQSPTTQWWTNSVINIDSLNTHEMGSAPYSISSDVVGYNTSSTTTAPMAGFKLMTAGAVYTVSSNISMAGLNIAAPKVALVTLGASTLSTSNVSSANCSGVGAVGTGAAALICAGGVTPDYLWIEVNKGSGLNFSTGTYGIYLYSTRYSRIHNSDIGFTSIPLKVFNSASTRPVEITDSQFHHGLGSAGMVIDTVNGLRLSNVRSHDNSFIGLSTNITNGIIEKSSFAKNGSNGVSITGTTGTTGLRISNTQVVSNSSSGLVITNSAKNNLFDVVAAGNGTSGFGLTGTGASDNVFYNVKSMSNGTTGLLLSSGAQKNTVITSIFNNNLGSGIVINGGGYNTFINVLSAAAGNTNFGLQLIGSSYNLFKKFVSVHNYINISTDSTSLNNSFYTLMTGNSAASDCSVAAVGNLIEGSSVSAGSFGTCPYTALTDRSISSSFKGKRFTDALNADNGLISTSYVSFSNITDFEKFSNSFTYWGKNTTSANSDPMASTTRGNCSSTNVCSMWDWRLFSGDTTLLNKAANGTTSNSIFTPGASCPSEISGSVTTADQMTTPNTFLTNAVEMVNDEIGDEDGLCETGETCLYAPNLGAFQGEGPLLNPCVYSGGTVGSVTMKAMTTLYGN